MANQPNGRHRIATASKTHTADTDAPTRTAHQAGRTDHKSSLIRLLRPVNPPCFPDLVELALGVRRSPALRHDRAGRFFGSIFRHFCGRLPVASCAQCYGFLGSIKASGAVQIGAFRRPLLGNLLPSTFRRKRRCRFAAANESETLSAENTDLLSVFPGLAPNSNPRNQYQNGNGPS